MRSSVAATGQDFLTRYRNVPSPDSADSTRTFPLISAQLGTSDREPGSVASSSSTSPTLAPRSALARDTSGPGHDWPRASTVVTVVDMEGPPMWVEGGGRAGEGVRRTSSVSGLTAEAVGDHRPHDAGFARADHLQVQQPSARGRS